MTDESFSQAFERLTGHRPMPWQAALYREHFRHGEFPDACDIPTGLGKTSVLAAWLIAWMAGASLPRRLAYVVNRRTVVDQTTAEAEKLRRKVAEGALAGIDGLREIDDLPISTLRGQFADNRAWSADPSRPAIVCGTVDMIGSRLLFSGYRLGFKTRPMHAGLLGQDTLIVHDEAHLEPAFQKTLKRIIQQQHQDGDPYPLRLMALTATKRDDDDGEQDASRRVLGLTEAESNPPTDPVQDPSEPLHFAWRRLTASKSLWLREAKGEKAVPETVGGLAKAYRDSGDAVLVFVRGLDDVKAVQKQLRHGKKDEAVANDRIETLTGTMRGFERDKLAKHNRVFARFLPKGDRACEPADGTVYLICTSAGEVGVNLSADHMVCDLSAYESMAQRLGRVNRFGDRPDTRVDVVHPAEKAFDEKHPLTPARRATLGLLRGLPPRDDGAHDASPLALSRLDPAARSAAFAPRPVTPTATDILFDAWALTSIRGDLPGRPPVAPYLHGIAEWEPPETHVAWRDELDRFDDERLAAMNPRDLLDEFPLEPQELLRERSDRAFKELEKLAKRHAERRVWLIDPRGHVQNSMTLGSLADPRHKDRLENMTVVLPPSVGGLSPQGTLDGGVAEPAHDVSDAILDGPRRRLRVRGDHGNYRDLTRGLRLVRRFDLSEPDADEQDRVTWDWFKLKPAEDTITADRPLALSTHTADVERRLEGFLQSLALPDDIASALRLAASLHDRGKCREAFQAMLGNLGFPGRVLAKSGTAGDASAGPTFGDTRYRHEFGSVLDAAEDPRVKTLSAETRDLVLHFIAAHHGRARPHFAPDEAFDPGINHTPAACAAAAHETARRYARLQRRFGRWGLAYYESLLRAADYAASAEPSYDQEQPS